MARMTPKQEALILSLCRRLDGGSYRYVEQAAHLLPIGRNAAKAMTVSDASLCIDHLQAAAAPLADQPEATTVQPTPVSTPGGPDAATLIAMLGRQVTVTWTNSAGETIEWHGSVQTLDVSETDGTPRLNLLVAGRTRQVRANALDTWIV